MIDQIEAMETPQWLMELTPEKVKNDALPLGDILQDSLYYPGAGSDVNVVKWLGGNVYSFVYTDYMVSKEKLLAELNTEGRNFAGYRTLEWRDLTMNELAPKGWKPINPMPDDGNPNRGRERFAKPFGIWAVFERLDAYDASHGPERFSLLYLCSDGVAGYQALYNSNGFKPKVLFLIHHVFGGNWTNFEDPEKILARSVRANRAGMPDYLIGRFASTGQSYWPNDYPGTSIFNLWGGCGFGSWRSNKKIDPVIR